VNDSSRLRLFWVSALALFIELALIRWIGCEIRIFAYFQNLILIACFLGFGLGFYHATRKARLRTSLILLMAVIAVVLLPGHFDWRWGPQNASRALANFHGTLFMGGESADPSVGAVTEFIVGLLWTFSLFVACLFVVFGYVQLIGADIESFGRRRRLEAYSWNVGGSLVGILAFSFACYLSLPPGVWFGGVFVATTPLLATWRDRIVTLLGLGLFAFFLIPEEGEVWSPYHKLEVSGGLIGVNGTAYMNLISFDPKRVTLPWDRVRLPHLLKPGSRRVLVLGAGGGNDVSAALHAGAEEVVAVEIDPAIYRLGRKLHPDAPYQDPRVRIVIDDARHFVDTTAERFDLIVMSHLDAHEALSSYTNVRLDNYIYTVESLRECRRLLSADGALYVSFWATKSWVATRLGENIRLAFGHDPDTVFIKEGPRVILAHYMIGKSPERTYVPEAVNPSNWTPPSGPPPPPLTDDWPFLFVESRHVPTPMLILAIPLAVMTTLILLVALRRKNDSASRRIDRHFFFLGAGFLLVEVHNVSRLARVFGTTWSVNAWVITGILLVILLANFLAGRWPRLADRRWVYPLLLVSLLVGAVLPLETIIALPLGRILVTVCYTLPLFFAGLIFAGSFRATRNASRALGSNILGAILGGFLELTSFVIGLGSLLYLSVLLYLVSFPARPGEAPETRAAS